MDRWEWMIASTSPIAQSKKNRVRLPGPMAQEFLSACWTLLRKVPKGKVTTYGDLARGLGNPGAARAVGTAMRLNPDAPRTPCHRVVGSDGRLGNYSGDGGVKTKIRLLRSEGVHVTKDGRVADFESVRWRPA
jgi:methylated-DNA-[protein]-cysteine S-methyltransferase